ncbi:alpha/beta hydrolase [Diaphorobacter aerolatus]|uniref:Lysophospholipase n=1 Tax=Diaphorobacter aerolatus TaxID=1288495 RepID=A0A7H0GGG7_9BURK|nr:alpha/beta hydrolase [Diaphorobacter aerolatus]QNP47383.1 lysophospholipase [Diaphorobacter aerolatus]
MAANVESALSCTSSVWFSHSGGVRLAIRDWRQPAPPARGMVLIVHGLGEHSGRYERLASRLLAAGFAVRAYDHFGHGQSDGPRGGMDHDKRFTFDLAHVLNLTITGMSQDLPLVLLGHSFGGLVAGHFVAEKRARIDALVLSSPALDPGLSPVQKALVATLPRVAPNLRVRTGLPLRYLSHDPSVIEAYRTDSQVHNRVSARLARYIATAGPATVGTAARWTVPTLLMWAGEDHFVAPAGSRAFAASAPADVVRVREFGALYHEIFNELHAEPVFAELFGWLDERFPENKAR